MVHGRISRTDWEDSDSVRESPHTHCDTYTHFLSLREKGQCLEEEMVSHCYD